MENASAGYMNDNDVIDGREGVRLPAVCTTATTTEPEKDAREITTCNFKHEQEKDSDYLQTLSTVNLPRSACTYDRNGFLTSIAPIAGAVQKVFPPSLSVHLLYHLHNACLAGHLGERRMYDITRSTTGHTWQPACIPP